MKLVLVALALAAIGGVLGGGRLSNLARLRLAWGPLAMLGLVLQVINPPGRWPLALLLLSFVLLTAFTLKNLRTPGFVLILIGVLLNFTVIAANAGMPVAMEAIVDSGQQDTLGDLLQQDLPKHHLASDEDRLLFLADVIAVPPPIRQAISVGDLFTFLGVAWVIVAASRRRPDDETEPDRSPGGVPEEEAAAGRARYPAVGRRLVAYVHELFHPSAGREVFKRTPALRAYEAFVGLPVAGFILLDMIRNPEPFKDWGVLAWIVAIAVVDLLPVPTSGRFEFSLSFPLELSAALIYADPSVAGLIGC